MQKLTVATVLLILPLTLFTLPSNGYAAVSIETEPDQRLALGLWFGYSPSSNTLLSTMSDTRLVLAGLEVIHTSFRIRNTTIRASTQLVLFGKTDFPKNGVYGPREQRNGFGLIPFKASIPLINSPGSYPYLSGGFGFLLFSQKFPNNDGTRFNATLEAGAGYQIYLGEQVSLDIEYRFHHMSNGETGQVNPGIDSNLFTAKLNIKI